MGQAFGGCQLIELLRYSSATICVMASDFNELVLILVLLEGILLEVL